MSGLGVKCLELIAGLTAEKMREVAASKLKGGDIMDENFRDLLLKEVDKIKEKLDGLSRVDLLSSVNFFKDGMGLLYNLINKSKCEQAVPSELSGEVPINISPILKLFNDVNCRCEDTRLKQLMKHNFQLAGEYSTKAFSNEGLDIEDRVIASSFRVHAALLSNLDNPDICVVLLKNYVEQLNSLSHVANTFRVQFSRDIIAWVKKAFNDKRREALIRSVVGVNRVVYEYIMLLTKPGDLEESVDHARWPFIDIGDNDNTINVITDPRVRKVCQEPLKLDGALNSPQDVAVNSNGLIIVADTCNHKVKFFTSTGTYLNCCDPVPDPDSGTTSSEDYNNHNFWPVCVGIDQEDNIYIASSRRRREDKNLRSQIVVFGSTGLFKHRFDNSVVLCSKSILSSMSLDLQGRVLVIDDHEDVVLVFSPGGKFLFKFGGWNAQEGYSHIAITNNGNIMITLWDHVNIYDMQGKQLKNIPMNHHGLPISAITYDCRKEQTTVLCKSYKHIARRLHTEDTPNLQIYSKSWDLLYVVPLPKVYRSAKGIATIFNSCVVVVNVDENELLII